MWHLGTKYIYTDGKKSVQYYYAEFYDRHRRPKRKRNSLKTRDKRAALQLFTALEREVAMGLRDPWGDAQADQGILLQAAVNRFIRSREDHCSDSTVDTYRYIIHSFANDLAADFPLYAVEERHISAFLCRGLADATANNYEQRLRIFFKWCIEQGYLRQNPVPRRVEVGRRETNESCHPANMFCTDIAPAAPLDLFYFDALREKETDQ